jgi:hypothetical protein
MCVLLLLLPSMVGRNQPAAVMHDLSAAAAAARVCGLCLRGCPSACVFSMQIGVAARSALISAASMTGDAFGTAYERAGAANALLARIGAAMGALPGDRVNPAGANAPAGIAELWQRAVVNYGAEALQLPCTPDALAAARGFTTRLAARAQACAAAAAAASGAGGRDSEAVAECEYVHAACFEALGPAVDAWVLVRAAAWAAAALGRIPSGADCVTACARVPSLYRSWRCTLACREMKARPACRAMQWQWYVVPVCACACRLREFKTGARGHGQVRECARATFEAVVGARVGAAVDMVRVGAGWWHEWWWWLRVVSLCRSELASMTTRRSRTPRCWTITCRCLCARLVCVCVCVLACVLALSVRVCVCVCMCVCVQNPAVASAGV